MVNSQNESYKTEMHSFKGLSEEVGIPYQILINLYLQDCVRSPKKLSLEWMKNVWLLSTAEGWALSKTYLKC